jgi:hypothetical protein
VPVARGRGPRPPPDLQCAAVPVRRAARPGEAGRGGSGPRWGLLGSGGGEGAQRGFAGSKGARGHQALGLQHSGTWCLGCEV